MTSAQIAQIHFRKESAAFDFAENISFLGISPDIKARRSNGLVRNLNAAGANDFSFKIFIIEKEKHFAMFLFFNFQISKRSVFMNIFSLVGFTLAKDD